MVQEHENVMQPGIAMRSESSVGRTRCAFHYSRLVTRHPRCTPSVFPRLFASNFVRSPPMAMTRARSWTRRLSQCRTRPLETDRHPTMHRTSTRRGRANAPTRRVAMSLPCFHSVSGRAHLPAQTLNDTHTHTHTSTWPSPGWDAYPPPLPLLSALPSRARLMSQRAKSPRRMIEALKRHPPCSLHTIPPACLPGRATPSKRAVSPSRGRAPDSRAYIEEGDRRVHIAPPRPAPPRLSRRLPSLPVVHHPASPRQPDNPIKRAAPVAGP
ncbi:hypothetical protein K438DRAFT_2028146 [Mycena galopus ATCC 62051]|nr:hypothetical protein K438DRAFT_2028146 [Mycena galopus ATCC 62051]